MPVWREQQHQTEGQTTQCNIPSDVKIYESTNDLLGIQHCGYTQHFTAYSEY